MTAAAALLSGTFDARSCLRDATHATHIRLHGLASFRRIAEGRLDLAGYRALLAALHAFHAAIARSAADGGLDHLSSSDRRITLLEQDLAATGGPLRIAPPMLPPAGRPALFGALYVAEGSTLGGRLIARQLDYLFGDQPAGRTFFAGDAATGPAWRGFLAALRAQCRDPAEQDRLIAGAEAAFALFEDCVGE